MSITRFEWAYHYDLVKGFHEDIVVSRFAPEHIPMEEFLRLLRA